MGGGEGEKHILYLWDFRNSELFKYMKVSLEKKDQGKCLSYHVPSPSPQVQHSAPL